MSGVDNNTLYSISYEETTNRLKLTPTTGGSPVEITLPKDTASNGLTKNGNDVQLGGNLTKNTTINHGSYSLTHSGTGKTIISSPLAYTNVAALPGEDKVLTSDANGNATWGFIGLNYLNSMVNSASSQRTSYLNGNIDDTNIAFDLTPGTYLAFFNVPFGFDTGLTTLGVNTYVEIGLIGETTYHYAYITQFVNPPFAALQCFRTPAYVIMTVSTAQRYHLWLRRSQNAAVIDPTNTWVQNAKIVYSPYSTFASMVTLIPCK